MSAARRRKKAQPGTFVGWQTALRYDRRFDRLEAAGQFWGIAGYQAPVKYNRCKHCGYRRHCAPELVDMKMRLGVTGKPLV